MSASAASKGAFAAINGLQHVSDPAAQVIGAAAALRALAFSINTTPERCLRIVERMEQDCTYREVNTMSAVRKYAAEMIRKHLL